MSSQLRCCPPTPTPARAPWQACAMAPRAARSSSTLWTTCEPAGLGQWGCRWAGNSRDPARCECPAACRLLTHPSLHHAGPSLHCHLPLAPQEHALCGQVRHAGRHRAAAPEHRLPRLVRRRQAGVLGWAGPSPGSLPTCPGFAHPSLPRRYDKHKVLQKEIGNTQFVACLNPTAGSFFITPRMQRQFATFAVQMPSQDNIRCGARPAACTWVIAALRPGHQRCFTSQLHCSLLTGPAACLHRPAAGPSTSSWWTATCRPAASRRRWRAWGPSWWMPPSTCTAWSCTSSCPPQARACTGGAAADAGGRAAQVSSSARRAHPHPAAPCLSLPTVTVPQCASTTTSPCASWRPSRRACAA